MSIDVLSQLESVGVAAKEQVVAVEGLQRAAASLAPGLERARDRRTRRRVEGCPLQFLGCGPAAPHLIQLNNPLLVHHGAGWR